MKWSDIKQGMRFNRKRTGSRAACIGTVVYASESFKIFRINEEEDIVIGNTETEIALYTLIKPMENK